MKKSKYISVGTYSIHIGKDSWFTPKEPGVAACGRDSHS